MNNEYKISNDFYEIISGTNNKTLPVYTEAVNATESDDKKSLLFIKKFLRSIGRVAPDGRIKNTDISKSKGNIKTFNKYKELDESFKLLEKYIPKNAEFKSLKNIKAKLEENAEYYIESYRRNIDILIMEYEASMYLLTEGLGFVIVTYITVENTKLGLTIKPNASAAMNRGIIFKLITDLDKELSSANHTNYIKEFINMDKTGVVKEAAGDATVATIELITTIFNQSANIFKRGKYAIKVFIKSIFGILPLIRSIIYLHYKRKADQINSLEVNAQFIQLNIEMLKNRTNIDPNKKAEIIKKQEAKVSAYLKRAEKLRAELVDTEKDTAASLEDDNKIMSKPSNDDDFILD
jgi:hypothetical protein